MGLRNDFRRVEDSYRAADQRLRESVVNQDSHRGQIVDTLLDSQDALLQTDEGQVFDAFQQQLTRSLELERLSAHRLGERASSGGPLLNELLAQAAAMDWSH